MIRAGLIASLACALAGCAGAPGAGGPVESPSYAAKTDRLGLVGQTRWVSAGVPVMLWDGPPKSKSDIMGNGTGHPIKSGEFTVTEANHSGLLAGYMVRFKDGRTGYMSETDARFTDDAKAHAAGLAEKATCDRKGGVKVGMTRAEVYASCWGKPGSINLTRTAGGDLEQLVYPGFNYVYLTNGKVSAIQASR